jgi:tRNA-splicing ligase RtcB
LVQPDDLTGVLSAWERIPAGLGYWHVEEDADWQRFAAQHPLPDSVEGDQSLRAKAPVQFGTLGSGNHFLELSRRQREQVWLMLHSGTRGVGNALAAMRHVEAAKDLMRRYFIELPTPTSPTWCRARLSWTPTSATRSGLRPTPSARASG